MASDDIHRRRFLIATTGLLGGGVTVVTVAPVLRFVIDPARKQTVTTADQPLDVGSAHQFRLGDPPRRVDVVAPVVADAWTAARDVVLGAAWVRRSAGDRIEALSGICPHLGCAVGWDAAAGNFLCPCHTSRFAVDGTKLSGPCERGLDPLPLVIEGDRIRLRWVRYKLGTPSRERA